MGLRLLHFKIADFIGVVLNGTVKTKLAILAFLYSGEFL